MKKSFYTFFILTVSLISAKAQTQAATPKDSAKKGNVRIIADPALDNIVYAKKYLTGDDWQLPGYRIQLYMGGDRKQALAFKAQMLNWFPGIPVYMDYEQPYFKIRVGDYRNRFEAMKANHDLQAKFKNISIVPDKIKFPAL